MLYAPLLDSMGIKSELFLSGLKKEARKSYPNLEKPEYCIIVETSLLVRPLRSL